MSIDQQVRHFQVPPSDTRTRDPKRESIAAPVSGRVFLTRARDAQATTPSVAARAPVRIVPDGANDFGGNMQMGMETAGGASTIRINVPADGDHGEINAWTHSDHRVVLSSDTPISFVIDGADSAAGAQRPNAFVARTFWVHVTFVLNGFRPVFQSDMWWPDGEVVEIDPAQPRFKATFTVEQFGIGTAPEVSFWSGGPYSQVVA